MIFPEALTELAQYRAFAEATGLPVLANTTEFGLTPLFTTRELAEAGVALVIYPLTAFRAMSAAAVRAYEALRREGTQSELVPSMQTRQQLYEVLGYDAYERKLDELFARENTQEP
jgi:methylisocitrate lyase